MLQDFNAEAVTAEMTAEEVNGLRVMNEGDTVCDRVLPDLLSRILQRVTAGQEAGEAPEASIIKIEKIYKKEHDSQRKAGVTPRYWGQASVGKAFSTLCAYISLGIYKGDSPVNTSGCYDLTLEGYQKFLKSAGLCYTIMGAQVKIWYDSHCKPAEAPEEAPEQEAEEEASWEEEAEATDAEELCDSSDEEEEAEEAEEEEEEAEAPRKASCDSDLSPVDRALQLWVTLTKKLRKLTPEELQQYEAGQADWIEADKAEKARKEAEEEAKICGREEAQKNKQALLAEERAEREALRQKYKAKKEALKKQGKPEAEAPAEAPAEQEAPAEA